MSIILKGINKSGGQLSKGIPPSMIRDVNIIDLGNGQLNITWKEPNDYSINDTILSKWKSSVLVYNDQHIPISIDDGTVACTNIIKDKYITSPLVLNVIPDKYFYYRFFTISTDNTINNDPEMIYRIISKSIKLTLSENDWETIINTINNGKAKDYWKVGDEKDIFLGGEFNETMTLQIWDFEHYNLTDGSGKNKIVFGTKHVTTNKYQLCTESMETKEYGWGSWSAILDVMKRIKNAMPEIVSNNIKEIELASNYPPNTGGYTHTKDYIAIPDYGEIGGYINNGDEYVQQFPIFTDRYSRIKKSKNGEGDNQYWHTRSSEYHNGYGGNPHRIVDKNGEFYYSSNSYSASWSYSICFFFCI